MKTQWDYTDLAEAYLKRPAYSPEAIDSMLNLIKIPQNADICDMGAGTAHLTLELAKSHFNVIAVEPNDAMREWGIKRTQEFSQVSWCEGTGEQSGQPGNYFDLVTFGSSFNVTDRQQALKETARILKPSGWFACMWNHRQLDDPIQSHIESIIGSYVHNYDYGARREDQSEVINASGLFEEVYQVQGTIQHVQTVEDCVTAWRSHGTLHRQAGDQFEAIIQEIQTFLLELEQPDIVIPYITHIWCAQLRRA